MEAFLRADRELLARRLPGLDERLAAAALSELEHADAPAIQWFREAGGPGLFVPADLGGGGAGLADGVHLQRALASRAPSLAVATAMHHFSVASLLDTGDSGTGFEDLLAEAVARDGLLIASGAGEGDGSGLVHPRMSARRTEKGLLVSGSKKPCSLSRSMDLLFATVRIAGDGEGDRFALAVIARESPGLSVRPFWGTPVLAAAESDEVMLEDVFVPARLVVELGPIGTTADAFRAALAWFELLIAASYLGICCALVERALESGKAGEQLAELVIEAEGAMLALDAVALKVDGAGRAAPFLGPALVARFGAQRAVTRAAAMAVEILGGRAFVGSGDVAYLQSATSCLAFHPPARHSAAESILSGAQGAPVDIA